MRLLHPVLLLLVCASPLVVSRAAGQAVGPAPVGITGRTVAPDGTPVTGGTVMLRSLGRPVTTEIEHDGSFRLIAERAGVQQLAIVTPDFAPYHVQVTVPPSRRMQLPPLQLAPATYFQVRMLSPAGEIVAAPRVSRRSWDRQGRPIFSPPDDPTPEHTDAEGRLTIGPLPAGRVTMATNVFPFAQMRLTDLDVTDEGGILDGGTIVLQPGTTLHVDVVDDQGVPVPHHDVSIEDAEPQSPMFLAPAKADAQGRATFTRLGAGQYVLRSRARALCAGAQLFVAQRVTAPGTGTARARLVVDGRAELRVTSPAAPLSGVIVTLAPQSIAAAAPRALPDPRLPLPLNPFARESACTAQTDAEGRASFVHVPPGPARVSMRLPNSTYTREISVSQKSGTITIHVPDGVLPLRVINAATKAPIAQARVTWASGGARVQGVSTASGDVLLEAATGGPGTLTIEAEGFQGSDAQFPSPPGQGQVIALTPIPASTVVVHVVDAAGDALVDAVVHLMSDTVGAIGHIATTDANGVAEFSETAPGGLRVDVSADGYAPRTVRVAPTERGKIQMTLSR